MNTLILGAGNVVAISIARYLSCAGHGAIMADSSKHARALYSKYCTKKYIFKDPGEDKEGFARDLTCCIKKEAVELLLPTTDEALLWIIEVKDSLHEGVKVLFPLDYEKINYVLNKDNIPAICRRSKIHTPSTYVINEDFSVSDLEGLNAPYVMKKVYSVGGEGFIKVDTGEQLGKELKKIKSAFPEENYLIQEYIPGSVHGAGGIFEDNTLKHFFSYEYIRRYPHTSGPVTICLVDRIDTLRVAMTKVLTALEWKGFCQMDFILEKESQMPYLIDINPVHWYSVPNSLFEEFNCLAYYVDGVCLNQNEKKRQKDYYVTVSLYKELQRIMSGTIFRKNNLPHRNSYWHFLRGLSFFDFFWDPLPIVLAPILRLLRKYC